VDDIDVSRTLPQRTRHRREHERRAPRPAPKARRDPRFSAEAAEVLRPDDAHVHPPLAHVGNEVGHEPAREVALAARIRRREDGDLQGASVGQILRFALNGWSADDQDDRFGVALVRHLDGGARRDHGHRAPGELDVLLLVSQDKHRRAV
jgi:hypothetical protein